MTRKYSVRLRALLPRVGPRLGTAQSDLASSMSSFQRKGTNFKWLRTGAHPPANTASATDQGGLTQERRNNYNQAQGNSSAVPVSTDNPTTETAPSPRWRVLQRRPGLVALLASSGIGLGALLWLFIVPPSVNCQQISPIATDSERLYCANQAAQQGKLDQLLAALALVRNWPQDHPLAPQVDQLTDKWSSSILAIAQQKMEQGHLEEAVSIARQVPQTSSSYPEAQSTITAWQSNWDQGQKIYNNAQEALKQQEWQQASEQQQLLTELNNEHWLQQAGKLNHQIGAERQAWEQLEQAQDLAQANTSEQLAQAIMLATQVNPQSYARDEAEAERERWSQALLEIANEYLEAEDFQGVVEAAEKVPLDSSVHAEAQDLVQFGQAQTFAQRDTLWGYVGAWTLGQQIQSNRPLYQEAQTDVTDWEGQIHSLAQLKLANWFANLGQIFAYQLAVDHAQMIQSDQPRRLQAQTLIAEWRKRIEILEDRPYIVWATYLAGQDTIQSLKLAIAQAGKIALGRILRLDAQTLIAQWIGQIQVLEDQPILNKAKALADQGQLGEAIEVAERISSGRALYGEAQAAIAQWVAQMQIAEDQPILDEATALANQGNLTQAITTASQISSGRALYAEAQGAISRWKAERDEIWAAREPEFTEPDSTESSSDSFTSEDDTVDEEDTDSDTSTDSESTSEDDSDTEGENEDTTNSTQ